MSRCQKCQNVKTYKTDQKANGAIFLKTETCAKLRKFCATCAKFFKKSDTFLLPYAFTVHGKNLGKLFQKKGMGMKFNIKNALSMAANIILSINDVKFHSHAFFWQNFTQIFSMHC